MYELIDTFNNTVISRHRLLGRAYDAMMAHHRAVKHANGDNSYIPTAIYKDGVEVSDEELDPYYYADTIN